MATYVCCNEDRREAVRSHATQNGIDLLEVVDTPGMPDSKRQKTILLTLFKDIPETISDNLPLVGDFCGGLVRIEGGARLKTLQISSISRKDRRTLSIEVAEPGDFSTYTLRLVRDPLTADPPEGFDGILSSIDFSFKAGCPQSYDCRKGYTCSGIPREIPEIDYCAKDYESFRKVILDRMALLVPGWTERNAADTGMTLVELLAYVADYLSYSQDAVATEAYLSTARKRVSVRRHARLVDYKMHEGCNARVWVHIEVEGDHIHLEPGTQLFTKVEEVKAGIAPGSRDYMKAMEHAPEVFETVYPTILSRRHNRMQFHTWGNRRCCLPVGATEAALKGHLPHLKAGDVLILVQQKDPFTGRTEDADRMHRHAVRLTHVWATEDPLEEVEGSSGHVTMIQWDTADALPIPFCISGTIVPDGTNSEYCDDISMAWGNIVLADHGYTLPQAEMFGPVPEPGLYYAAAAGKGNYCVPLERDPVPVRFRPQLGKGPLTYAIPYPEQVLFGLSFSTADDEQNLLELQKEGLDNKQMPTYLNQAFIEHGIELRTATLSIQGFQDVWSLSDGDQAFVVRFTAAGQDNPDQIVVMSLLPPADEIHGGSPKEACPAITMSSRLHGESRSFSWTPVPDLLNSCSDAREFVVEMESDGSASIRFGDGTFGKRPVAGEQFEVVYRRGNGPGGNIGGETLAHIVSDIPDIKEVTNPLPAFGGHAPESIENVRQIAPYMFRHQERAITPEDYAEIAMRHPSVQRAAANLQWTGSWYTVYLTIDRFGGKELDDQFRKEFLSFLNHYRFMGQDVEIRDPQYVPIEIEMNVCVKPGYSRDTLRRALSSVFSGASLQNGKRGVFHPDNFSLGQPVYLSGIYQAAQAVEGVSSCDVILFQRLGHPGSESLEKGKLAIGRLEIARLDNNPNLPEYGVFRINLEGGI